MPSSWHHVTLRNSPQHIMRTLCTCCVYMLLGSRVTVGMTTADCVVQCMYGTGVQLVVPNCVVEGQNRTICLSVCLSVCRSVGRSVCLSVCLAGWLAGCCPHSNQQLSAGSAAGIYIESVHHHCTLHTSICTYDP